MDVSNWLCAPFCSFPNFLDNQTSVACLHLLSLYVCVHMRCVCVYLKKEIERGLLRCAVPTCGAYKCNGALCACVSL